MDTQLSLSNLSKRYANGVLALTDINLDVHHGEFVVLVGPSGCGKSTLLRMIAGLDAPSSGIINIAGIDVTDVPPAARGIGMVFQDYALYPHMTVLENLCFGLKLQRLGREEITARSDEISKMLELQDFLSRKPAELSGGQRQRVAIGRALIKKPALLLLDEPLSNLDAQLRADTRIEIRNLHRRIGSTTIYVTHDQEEAMTLADRLVVLEHGAIQQVDIPISVYSHPSNRFVASFIGSPRMNILETTIVQNGGMKRLQTHGQSLEIPSQFVPGAGNYCLGFRPEAAYLAAKGLSLRMSWVELHGHEIHVVADLDGKQLILRTADPAAISTFRSIPSGTAFSIGLNPQLLHWFDESNGRLDLETTIAA